MPTLAQLKKRADNNHLAVRKSPSRNQDTVGYGMYAVIDLESRGTIPAMTTP